MRISDTVGFATLAVVGNVLAQVVFPPSEFRSVPGQIPSEVCDGLELIVLRSREGDDGLWSTFALNVGRPAQTVHVLVSTSSCETWVVSPSGCTSNDNCPDLRGIVYDKEQSNTWIEAGPMALTTVGWSALNYSANGDYGYDAVGPVNSAKYTLNHQVVALFATNDYYTGLLGLGPYPVNLTRRFPPQRTYFTSLKDNGLIPSLTWCYTAGAPYRDRGYWASLTFGGYDSSRFKPSPVNFPFANNQNLELVVSIQSIQYGDRNNTIELLSEGVPALIESTHPYIWLSVSKL